MRNLITKAALTLATAGLLAGGLAVAVPTAALAADGCTQDSTGTLETKDGYAGRIIQLRYNPNSWCAWGRISNGRQGDHIWVDRSTDGGRTWQQLGWTTIAGATSTQRYTEAFYDGGNYVMRACGDAGFNTPITCTGWH
ncbi:DUF2690 domain-containing protein [Longispora albida]|uniref:DUF2690 domain-containing protein n=1 Tax=Longispora albida TaxID=203523 RepID=UPI000377D70B|nr:DUF2690 domain-containing protein [Longispora albida]